MTGIVSASPSVAGTTTENAIQSVNSMFAEMQAAKEQFELVATYARKTVDHVWRMGKALSKAHVYHRSMKPKLSEMENWAEMLQRYGISIPSDNRARRLYEACPDLERLQGLTIMEAYEVAGITKTKSKSLTAPTSDETVNSNQAPSEQDDATMSAGDGVQSDRSQIVTQRNAVIASSQVGNRVVDLFEHLIDEIEKIQTTLVGDADLNEALSRIEELAELVNQIKSNLKSRHAVETAT